VEPGLDVVIVSYNTCDLLRACLSSLRAYPPARPMTVHVVDNASRDGTVAMVRHEFPEVRVTASRENLGFGAATNRGIRDGAHEYVLALNPDAAVEASTLDVLLELMDARPEIGISGCSLIRTDGSADHAAKRSFPTILGALGHFSGVAGRTGAAGRLAQYRAPDIQVGPVDAVNGAFMLIRRSALENVGLFDEAYWMYMEDLDLCYRFKEQGWVTWYEPSVAARHVKHGASGSRRGVRLEWAFHYGMLRFYRKHYASNRAAAVNVAVYAGVLAKFVLAAARGLIATSSRAASRRCAR
jgi:N-acetylglucosaminyl-diphospho-decaprenol L-rhamnosyltransferase